MLPGKNTRLKKKGEILLTVFCNPVIVEKIIPRHALRENRNKELSVFRILFNKFADGKKFIVNARNLCGGADRRVRIVCPIVVKCFVQKPGDRLAVHDFVKEAAILIGGSRCRIVADMVPVQKIFFINSGPVINLLLFQKIGIDLGSGELLPVEFCMVPSGEKLFPEKGSLSVQFPGVANTTSAS